LTKVAEKPGSLRFIVRFPPLPDTIPPAKGPLADKGAEPPIFGGPASLREKREKASRNPRAATPLP